MTPVEEPTAGDRRWQALSDELAPAKSLQRLDAASGRVISAVSVVAAVLTGFGLLVAGLVNLPTVGRVLAVTAVVLAVVALLLALRGQVVTVIRGLNLDDQLQVQDWFAAQFERRTHLARWAARLLVVAVATAGSAAVLSLVLGGRNDPTLAVTRTADTVVADVSFRDLGAGQPAVASISVDGQVFAQAAFGPGPDGAAVRSLTATKVAPTAHVMVAAEAGADACTAMFSPGSPPALACRSS